VTALLETEGLRVVCGRGDEQTLAIDAVSLTIGRGEVVGLIGESGSGKTTLVRTVIGLQDRTCRPVTGRIRFGGDEVFGNGVDRLHTLRGRHIGMIFQHSTASLNPLLKVGTQLDEVLRVHDGGDRNRHGERIAGLLSRLGFDDPERVRNSYPHQLSGGMAQRVAIALAVATEPDMVIADECTSALDVTTQAEVIALLRSVTLERNWTLLFVTHDILLATELCTRLVVLYGGQVVEDGPTGRVVDDPRHPYTRALLEAVPVWGPRTPLREIPGTPPRIPDGFVGCRFAPRCDRATSECVADDVSWTFDAPDRGHRCLHPLSLGTTDDGR
jgi:oligopeptide/dipeptide ABC transporter ATP-binding protein